MHTVKYLFVRSSAPLKTLLRQYLWKTLPPVAETLFSLPKYFEGGGNLGFGRSWFAEIGKKMKNIYTSSSDDSTEREETAKTWQFVTHVEIMFLF